MEEWGFELMDSGSNSSDLSPLSHYLGKGAGAAIRAKTLGKGLSLLIGACGEMRAEEGREEKGLEVGRVRISPVCEASSCRPPEPSIFLCHLQIREVVKS